MGSGSMKTFLRSLVKSLPIVFSAVALLISFLVYWSQSSKADFEKRTANRRFLIDTLREIQNTERELQGLRSKVGGSDNLSTDELLLLKYHEVLSRTLAEYVDMEPALFSWAKCTHGNSVRLRSKPSANADQIGGIVAGARVAVLGKFCYPEGATWYYVVTPEKKIGWGYGFFEFER